MAQALPAADDQASAARTRRRFGLETVLAVAGALVVLGFFLPWFDVSGLDVAGSGGAWTGLFAVPAFALLTAVFGGLRWRLARYTGSLTAIAMLVPAVYLLATQWPWLYTVPLAVGVAAIVVGFLGRWPWSNLMLGAVLLALSGLGPLLARDELGLGVIDEHGLVLAVPLIALGLLMPLCAVWLLWSAARKRGRERALIASGCAIIALDAYAAALVAFGPALADGGVGFWLSAVGGSLLLVLSRPLRGRRSRKPAAAAKPDAPAAKPAAKPAKPAKPQATASAPETTAKPAAAAAAPPDGDAAALKQARIEKLKKLKKLQILKERKAAAAKAAEAEEAATERAAEADEAATARAGAALASEPEPQFAADPTRPAAPDNEDREALMQRMGVKPPPPPSDGELEDMLAALKKRAGD